METRCIFRQDGAVAIGGREAMGRYVPYASSLPLYKMMVKFAALCAARQHHPCLVERQMLYVSSYLEGMRGESYAYRPPVVTRAHGTDHPGFG